MATKDPPMQTPGIDDALRLPGKPFLSSSRGPGAVCLDNFIQAMNATGDDAEANYDAALRDLRRNYRSYCRLLGRSAHDKWCTDERC